MANTIGDKVHKNKLHTKKCKSKAFLKGIIENLILTLRQVGFE